jgi:hypothetical protein
VMKIVTSDEHLMRKETGMRQGAVMMWSKNESYARVTIFSHYQPNIHLKHA